MGQQNPNHQLKTVVNIPLFTLWLFNIVMENGPLMDDFPIKTSILSDFPGLC